MKRTGRSLSKLLAMSVGFAALISATPVGAVPPVTLEAALQGGAAEVPGPGDPDGSGGARVTVNVQRQKVCYTLVVLDITLPAAAAHIHAGAADVAGDVVVTLGAPQEIDATGIGLARGCVRDQSKALLRDIRRNPELYYVNVHTSDFPNGAVRGQLAIA